MKAKQGGAPASTQPRKGGITDLHRLITALQSLEMPSSESGLEAGSAPQDANDLVCGLVNWYENYCLLATSFSMGMWYFTGKYRPQVLLPGLFFEALLDHSFRLATSLHFMDNSKLTVTLRGGCNEQQVGEYKRSERLKEHFGGRKENFEPQPWRLESVNHGGIVGCKLAHVD